VLYRVEDSIQHRKYLNRIKFRLIVIFFYLGNRNMKSVVKTCCGRSTHIENERHSSIVLNKTVL